MISICTGFAACTLLAFTEPNVATHAVEPIGLWDSVSGVATDEHGWSFDAFVYYWSASVGGDLTIEGEDVDLDDGGDGIFEISALTGFLGNFEAHRGPWSFVFAPIFIHVEMDGDQSGAADADVEIDAQVHEGFVAHEIGGAWQWLAGARYYELDAELDLSVGGVPTGSEDAITSWVDPIVGARYRGRFGEDWSLNGRADIGGFGVGSDFAWNASLLVGYHFSSCVGAHVGYRALSLDFEDGTGGDHVEYNLSMYGPIIGVSFAF